jgi:hypothetical protein
MVYVGDDWAEDHHDVELVDDDGRRLARARLPEGLEGITRLHSLIAAHMPASWAQLDPTDAAARVRIGIETERDQPDVGGPLPAAALHLRREVRCW